MLVVARMETSKLPMTQTVRNRVSEDGLMAKAHTVILFFKVAIINISITNSG